MLPEISSCRVSGVELLAGSTCPTSSTMSRLVAHMLKYEYLGEPAYSATEDYCCGRCQNSEGLAKGRGKGHRRWWHGVDANGRRQQAISSHRQTAQQVNSCSRSTHSLCMFHRVLTSLSHHCGERSPRSKRCCSSATALLECRRPTEMSARRWRRQTTRRRT